MSTQREIERSIRRLSKLLRKMILNSKEFEELCLLLQKGKLDMRLFLVPVLFKKEEKKRASRRKRTTLPSQFKLTAKDRQFLKKVGIRF